MSSRMKKLPSRRTFIGRHAAVRAATRWKIGLERRRSLSSGWASAVGAAAFVFDAGTAGALGVAAGFRSAADRLICAGLCILCEIVHNFDVFGGGGRDFYLGGAGGVGFDFGGHGDDFQGGAEA